MAIVVAPGATTAPEQDGYGARHPYRPGEMQESYRRPTIIALTGRGPPEDRRKAREAALITTWSSLRSSRCCGGLLSSIAR